MLGTLAAPATVVPSVARAVRALQIDVIRIITDIGAFFERPFEIRGYLLDLSQLYQELSGMLRTFVGSVAQGTIDVVLEVASGAFWLIIILIAAYYLVKDGDRLVEQLSLIHI